MRTEYPARIEPWLVGLVVGAPLILITVGIFALFTSVGAGVYKILSGLVIGGVITALWPTRVYTLTDDALIIPSGSNLGVFPLSKIRAAVAVTSIWSAPVLSIRRIKLTLNDDNTLIIAPKNREAFLTDLAGRRSRVAVLPSDPAISPAA